MVAREEAMTSMDTSRTAEVIDQDRRRLLGTATMGIAVAGAASLLPSQLAAAPAGDASRPFRVAGDMNVPQPTTSTGVRVPFLHGLPTDQIAGQSELASLERANEWLNSPPLTASALRGKV